MFKRQILSAAVAEACGDADRVENQLDGTWTQRKHRHKHGTSKLSNFEVVIAQIANIFTCTITFMLDSMSIYNAMGFTIPHASEMYGYNEILWTTIFSIALLFVICNLVQFYRHHSKLQTAPGFAKEPTVVQPTYTGPAACDLCGVIKPARAHHCVLCQACILKHDHHCFLTGSCIGQNNQRYFLVYLFYACIGTYMSVHFSLLWLYPRFTWWDCFHYKTYVQYTYGGTIDSDTIFVILMVIAGTYGFLGSGYCFACLMVGACRNQTSYERSVNNYSYSGSLSDNLQAVFGPSWYMNFLIPWRSQLENTISNT